MAIELIGTIKPKNNGKFPMVESTDVEMPDGTRLDKTIEKLSQVVEITAVLNDGSEVILKLHGSEVVEDDETV